MSVPQHDPWDGEYDEYEYCEDNSEDIGPRSADRHVSFFHFCLIIVLRYGAKVVIFSFFYIFLRSYFCFSGIFTIFATNSLNKIIYSNGKY